MRVWLQLCIVLLGFVSEMTAAEIKLIHSHAKTGYPPLFEEFTKQTGIKIHHEFRTQDRLKSEILLMVESGDLPDAIILPADHLGLHTYLNYSAIDRAAFSLKLQPRLWETTQSDGKYYGVPLSQGNHLMLYYNKALVTTPAATWEILKEQAKILKQQSIWPITWSHQEPYWFLPYLTAFGGWLFEGNQITLNTEAMANTLDFYRRIRNLAGDLTTCSYECGLEHFKSGTVAYIINGDWAFNELYEAMGENLGVSAIPSIDDKVPAATFTTQAIAFPNNGLTGHKKHSLVKLTDYLQSPKAQLLLWETHNAIPIHDSLLNSIKRTTPLPQKSIIDLMQTTRALPSEQNMSFVWDALTKGMLRHHEGALTSQDAAQYMQLLTERHIRNAQRHATPTQSTP